MNKLVLKAVPQGSAFFIHLSTSNRFERSKDAQLTQLLKFYSLELNSYKQNIDDDLMKRALDSSEPKKAAVEEAFWLLIKLKGQARLVALKGAVK